MTRRSHTGAVASGGAVKPYTVMVYMNGSDLESESGAATEDLLEMLESGADADGVNLIVFTGGASRWKNDLIPADECVIWSIENGGISKVTGVGLKNMGDPDTLSGFIGYCLDNYPARKYGLIFWDHGGGSIAGYGDDEIFNNSRLTLNELGQAFSNAGLPDGGLEFIGFDACLMATAEMAVVASDYADYLIASEDVEPGQGWDYGFLSVFSREHAPDGAAVGRDIADRYMEFYGADTDESLTLSVTDLSLASGVMDAMGELMSRCTRGLLEDREASYGTLARRRVRTKSFGGGSQRDTGCDMVDVGDMAAKLSDLFPDETARLLDTLSRAVVYNRHNSETDLGGLTAYYIFDGKGDAQNTLRTYSELGLNDDYTEYLHEFADTMTGGQTGIDPNGLLREQLAAWLPVPGGHQSVYMAGLLDADDETELWPFIGGAPVCAEEVDRSDGGIVYAVPVAINGRDADLIIFVNEKYPGGRVMGSRREDGYIIQKGLDAVKDGDEIEFYYRMRNLENGAPEGWYVGNRITAAGGLVLEWLPLDPLYYSYLLTDMYRNQSYTDFTPRVSGGTMTGMYGSYANSSA